MFFAKALSIAPRKKLTAPQSILARRPLLRVTCEAPNVETSAAKYKEEVNKVSI